MTSTTTTPPVTVVCCGALLITMMVTLASISVGHITLGQHDVAQLIPRNTMSSAGLTNILQQQWPQSQMPSQVYTKYALGSLQAISSFRVESPNSLYVMCWCLVWCLLCVFRFPCGGCVHYESSTIEICNTTIHQSLPLAGIYASCWRSMAHTSRAPSGVPTALSRGAICY